MAYLMGIDIGTSSVKTVLFTPQGALEGLAAQEYAFDVPLLGWAEQDPDLWWEAVRGTVRQVLARSPIDPRDIKGIGLSGQMHGMIPLNRDRQVIRKAILHCDVRSTRQVAAIQSAMGDRFSSITYNPVFPGFQLVSLLWMRDNEPAHYEKTDQVVCPKDYIRFRLTGQLATESTDASGTLAYDIQKQDWSDEILSALQVDRSLFPGCRHQPFEVAGSVTKWAAGQTGLAEGTTVVFGGGDQAMHSLGNGVCQKGVTTATIGTSGQVLTVTDQPVWNPAINTHTFRHVLADTWFGLGAVLHAGVNLNWFRREFARDLTYPQLDQEAAQAPPCCDGLVFFPCMGGERTPYMDAKTRGIFFGMTQGHTRGHMARAVMEGVAFAMKESVDILGGIYPHSQRLICAGGGAKSKLWLQIQADIYGREVYIAKTPEQACTGAAIAAGVGCGLFASLQEGCDSMVQIDSEPISPIAEHTGVYQRFHQQVYSQLYRQNHHLFPRLADFSS